MDYKSLFKKGSLFFIKELVGKIVYDGLGADTTQTSQMVVLLISGLITVFLLYKLFWLVWQSIKFIISCLEW